MVAQVVLSKTAYSFDKLYSYSVPESLEENAVQGVV